MAIARHMFEASEIKVTIELQDGFTYQGKCIAVRFNETANSFNYNGRLNFV